MAGRPTIFRPNTSSDSPSIYRRETEDAGDLLFDDAPGNFDDLQGTFDSPEIPQ